MRRSSFLAVILSSVLAASVVLPCAAQDWRAKLSDALPLLGHRNWILIVDSAYPLQSGPGIETIETNEGELEVVRHVLHAIDNSIHVRPVIYMDSELPFVPDAAASGASHYRAEIGSLLSPYGVQSLPHDRMIATVAQTSQQFQVLVLKTNITVPYSSVFIRLDCKYWSDDAEKSLRSRMANAPPASRQSPHP